jgi:hypothetical protein
MTATRSLTCREKMVSVISAKKVGEGGFIDLEFQYVEMLFLWRFFVVAVQGCLVPRAHRLAPGASRLL